MFNFIKWEDSSPVITSTQQKLIDWLYNRWFKLQNQLIFLFFSAIIKDILKVGRSQICDVILTESNIGGNININNVSKEHFTIFKKPGSSFAYLVDSSKNGTFINGIRTKKNELTILKNKDKVSIGQKRPFSKLLILKQILFSIVCRMSYNFVYF